MPVFHPHTASELRTRNELLQSALRSEPSSFDIAAEYPLVLGASGASFSYCSGGGDGIQAHANLWPRTLICPDTNGRYAVGLIGNVATAERFRGQGMMNALMTDIKRQAVDMGMEALLLWSDLLEFYQKLGFQSFGHECRWQFASRDLVVPRRQGWRQLPPDEARSLAAAMLTCRFPVPMTLERSFEEFQALLTIPALKIFGYFDHSGTLTGYLLEGRGADLVGVVHEWGSPDPDCLLTGIAVAAASAGLSQLTLLSPAKLPKSWYSSLRRHAVERALHPTGLAWYANDNPNIRAALDACFIWGMDSI